MKYIDTDKLIAEIERMRKINRKALESDHIGPDVFHGRAQTLNYLFEFIDSLKQEIPEVDFETEYAKFTNDPDELEYAFPIDLADYKDFARHFYELGFNAKKRT